MSTGLCKAALRVMKIENWWPALCVSAATPELSLFGVRKNDVGSDVLTVVSVNS
jgi:hypothetical protein